MGITYEFLNDKGFKQLGNRPIWSNGVYQLHQYPEGWGVFKKKDDNVLYEDTGITIHSEFEFNYLSVITNLWRGTKSL